MPPEIKAELDRLLIIGSFSGYDGIMEWLNEQLSAVGLEFSISRSAIHRYGQSVEERISRLKAATDMAVAITDQVGDDAGKMSDAVVRMYQEKIFNVLLDMNDLDPKDVDFTKLGKVIATVTRSSVTQKKWMAEAKEKSKQALQNIEEKTKSGKKSLDPETLRIIREEIYGIV